MDSGSDVFPDTLPLVALISLLADASSFEPGSAVLYSSPDFGDASVLGNAIVDAYEGSKGSLAVFLLLERWLIEFGGLKRLLLSNNEGRINIFLVNFSFQQCSNFFPLDDISLGKDQTDAGRNCQSGNCFVFFHLLFDFSHSFGIFTILLQRDDQEEEDNEGENGNGDETNAGVLSENDSSLASVDGSSDNGTVILAVHSSDDGSEFSELADRAEALLSRLSAADEEVMNTPLMAGYFFFLYIALIPNAYFEVERVKKMN